MLWPQGPTWVTLPVDPPEQHRTRVQYQLTLSGDGTIAGKVDGRVTGNAAAALLAAMGSQSDEDLTTALYAGAGTHPRLTGVTLAKNGSPEQELAFSAQVRGHVEKLGYEKFLFRPADAAGLALPGDWRTSRRFDALLAAPRSTEDVVTLDLPASYNVELPPPVRITRAYADYSAGFERRERTLTYTRRLRLRSPLISAAEWDDFKRFTDQIADQDAHGVRIWIKG